MKSLKVSLNGLVPLLTHSSALVDKLNPYVREMSKITSKGSKKITDADLERLARLEWEGGLWLSDGKPAVPTSALEACFKDGAKAARRGKDADRSVWVDGDAVPLVYDGPKSLDEMWEARKRFVFTAPVRVNNSRVMRTRGIFRTWKVSFEMFYDEQDFNERAIQEAWDEAGRRGLGDWRPKYGRFEVKFS